MIANEKFELRSALVVGLMTVLVAFTGCAGGTQSGETSSISTAAATNSSDANSISEVPENVATSSDDSNGSILTASNRLQLMRKEAQESNVSQPTVKASFEPAPDNSEYSMQLTDVGLEIRRFKSHPQLLRVEKTITPEKQTVKVFLKDGRVISVPSEKVSSIRNDPASIFLAAAGIGTATAPTSTEAGAKERPRP